MKQADLTIEKNEKLTRDVLRMTLTGDVSGVTNPGQFVNIAIDGFYLRRPISVCDKDDGRITLIYKVVGDGTRAMSGMKEGEVLDTLTGLGNGYSPAKAGSSPLLIGGGVGIPPLFWLCKDLIKNGVSPSVILGFNTADEIFLEDEFRALGVPVTVTTVDGSRGVKGFVTDAIDPDHSYFYACGPLPMLRAVAEVTPFPGEMSFEERMGCGFGACMGCSVLTKNGPVRVCRDGPVIPKEDVIW
ncbi:MAG: dihydroorotate dehydrogenase electron transfer subunit [Clostridia bacterium]|nr:dihydroorotate dehydrogenase electron transfer subunit [Clostridia bacterium]